MNEKNKIEDTYRVINLWIERFLMERIETWPSLKRPSFIQFYPNIKIVKITKNISPRYHRIFIYVKPTENCLSDLFFFFNIHFQKRSRNYIHIFSFFQTYYDSSYNGIHGFDQSINFSFPDIMVIHLFYNCK